MDPLFLSGAMKWSGNQGELGGNAGAGKRKRIASVASAASAAGNDGCDEDGDHEMVDGGCAGK